MNIKAKSIISVLMMSAAVFAAEPPAPTAVRAADAAPAAEVADAAVSEAALAAEVADAAVSEAAPEATAEVADAAASEAASEATAEVAAPKAVRDGAAPAETSSAVAAPAPTTQRRVDTDTLPPVTYYRTTYAPVKTVYVAAESEGDTVTLDELRGYVPFKMALGAQASIGTYSLSDYSYYDDSFFDITLRAGLTSIIPLNKYTVAMKVGAVYEQSKASGSLYYTQGYGVTRVDRKYHVEFKQRKIDIPVLFSFKSAHSNVMFDIGAQAAVGIYDKMEISYKQDGKSHDMRVDMIDEDYRNTLEWSIVFGLEFRANKYIAMNLRYDLGLSSLYDSFDDEVIKVDDLTASSFLVGLSFYFL